jgi:hypothetical protein
MRMRNVWLVVPLLLGCAPAITEYVPPDASQDAVIQVDATQEVSDTATPVDTTPPPDTQIEVTDATPEVAQDTGAPDAGMTDTGALDTGEPDTGPPDTGTADTGVADTGTPDTGRMDTGTPDTGVPDTGRPDTGAADTGFPDTGPPPCPGSQVRCSGVCVDTMMATANCGACGNACPARPNAPATCEAGSCTLQCDPGWRNCDGNVANGCESFPSGDLRNCGACGWACPSPANGVPLCMGGTCQVICLAGYGDCNGSLGDGCETDLRVTAANCGVCGHACGTGFACVGGTCTCAAPTPDYCTGSCVNTQTDVANCGACGHDCGPNIGMYEWACCRGTCTNIRSDPGNCGGCGVICGGPRHLCYNRLCG